MTATPLFARQISRSLVITGIALGALVWMIEAVVHGVMDPGSSFTRALLPDAASEIVIRSLTMLIVIGFSVYAGAVFAGLRRSEVKLAESEQLYHNLVEAARDIIFSLAPDRTVISINHAFEEITGRKGAEVMGRAFDHLLHPEDTPRFTAHVRTVINGQTPPPFEVRIMTREGESRILELKLSPRLGPGGSMAAFGIARDMTDRRLHEQAIRESESKYRDLLENAHDIIQMVSADGSFLYVNQAWREALGYTSEEAAGLRMLDIIHPEYKPHCMDAFMRVMAGERLDQIEAVFVSKQGRSVVVEGNINCSFAEGKPVATRGIFRDVTEHRQATAFIKNILESVDEGFIVIDAEYRIISANKAFSQKVQLPFDQIIGKYCHVVTHRLPHPCYESGEDCAVKQTFLTGEPYMAVHLHYDRDNNPVYVETKSFPLRDSLGRIISVIEIHNDITEKKRLEDQLRHAQKMEAVGTLAGGIAHDFNNILTAIIGYGTLLQMKMGSADPLRSFVDQILISTERAATLTQNLLAFSRKQAVTLKPLDLNQLVRRVDKLVERLIGEDISIRTDFNTATLTVKADAGQLEQVLLNLVTNARDAMPGGGVLTVATDVTDIDAEFIRTNGFGHVGRYALMTLSDTGCGMDEPTRARIFEPFFTTKEVGKGTGLGLSIVYGIVKQHGGFITVKSEPDAGTMFTIYLPVITASVEKMVPAEAQEPEGGMATILVAEDDESVRRLNRAVLEGFGYTVIEAVDGEDAAAKFWEHKQSIDLLLLDIVMPKKSGAVLYDEVRRERPEIKALFTSGYAAEIIHAKGLLKESFNFIAKPVSPRELLIKVKEILDQNPAAARTI